jgi:hypothetical protein
MMTFAFLLYLLNGPDGPHGDDKMDPKISDQLAREGGEASATMVAIMILMAREAQRDPGFPEHAKNWLDRSLASMLSEKETELQKQQFIYARAHFQKLLGSVT